MYLVTILYFPFPQKATLFIDSFLNLGYIYSKKEVRIARLKQSRQYSEEKIEQIMKSQLSEEEFRKFANVVLDNSFEFESTMTAIQEECVRVSIYSDMV